jgi:deazaflavin-dependent oxidoreductase (nitroreductase family)
MTQPEEVFDSPIKNVAEHARRYLETDGEKGYLYYGKPTLLLTVRGRKSGKLYRTPLIYGQDGDRYMVVPSNGGSAEPPAWYLNLVENPEVEVQINAEKFSARARDANAEEKPKLWQIMTTVFPQYKGFQAKTKREIPVVILERI